MSVTPETFYTYVSPKAHYNSVEAQKSSYWETMSPGEIPEASSFSEAGKYFAFKHVARNYKAKLIGISINTTYPSSVALSFQDEGELKNFKEALEKEGLKTETSSKIDHGSSRSTYTTLKLSVALPKDSPQSHLTKLARCINSFEKLPLPIMVKMFSSLKTGEFNYEETLKAELGQIFNTFLNSLASSETSETDDFESMYSQKPSRMSPAETKTWEEAFQFAEASKSPLLYMTMADNYSGKLKSLKMGPTAILAGVKLIDSDDTVRLNLDPKIKGRLYYLAAKLNVAFYRFPDQGSDAPGKDSSKEPDEFLRIAFKQAVEASRAGHPGSKDLINQIIEQMRKRELVFLPGPANCDTADSTIDMLFEVIGTPGKEALKQRPTASATVPSTTTASSTAAAPSSSTVAASSASARDLSLSSPAPVLAFSTAALSSATATSTQSGPTPLSRATADGAAPATPPASTSASSSQPSTGSASGSTSAGAGSSSDAVSSEDATRRSSARPGAKAGQQK